MAPEVMASLVKLPAADRVELAMALWDSLDEMDRESAVDLTADQVAALQRRSAEHRADPSTASQWSEVRRKLTGDT
jgi:putative addiction module component (TIGR02574 family)